MNYAFISRTQFFFSSSFRIIVVVFLFAAFGALWIDDGMINYWWNEWEDVPGIDSFMEKL